MVKLISLDHLVSTYTTTCDMCIPSFQYTTPPIHTSVTTLTSTYTWNRSTLLFANGPNLRWMWRIFYSRWYLRLFTRSRLLDSPLPLEMFVIFVKLSTSTRRPHVRGTSAIGRFHWKHSNQLLFVGSFLQCLPFDQGFRESSFLSSFWRLLRTLEPYNPIRNIPFSCSCSPFFTGWDSPL